MGRKPQVTKVDAELIAVRYATAHGVSVTGAVEVNRRLNDGPWHVFIPHGLKIDPAGVIVLVDQHSGKASFFPTL